MFKIVTRIWSTRGPLFDESMESSLSSLQVSSSLFLYPFASEFNRPSFSGFDYKSLDISLNRKNSPQGWITPSWAGRTSSDTYVILFRFNNWIHKRNTNQTTMSGLRQRMQLYGAIPVQSLVLLQMQQAAMSNLNGTTQQNSSRCNSLSPDSSCSYLVDRRNSFTLERPPSREEAKQISRLILPSDASLLNRRISNSQL